MTLTPNSNDPIKLKVNLEDMPLPVSRKILVPANINMMQLHFVIQLAMGWEFAHLFQFTNKKYEYDLLIKLRDEFDEDFFPYKRYKLLVPEKAQLKKEFQINRDSKPFYYCYDFGDNWIHKITFQKPTKKDLSLYTGIPFCVEATGLCPPEDVGGPWGYANFLEAIHNKKHPEHKEFCDWLGLSPTEEYDEEAVDLEDINETLKHYYNGPEWNLKSKDYFQD